MKSYIFKNLRNEVKIAKFNDIRKIYLKRIIFRIFLENVQQNQQNRENNEMAILFWASNLLRKTYLVYFIFVFNNYFIRHGNLIIIINWTNFKKKKWLLIFIINS